MYTSNAITILNFVVVNRQLILNQKLQTRIAVVQLTKDQSHSYNAIMNCIFRYCVSYYDAFLYFQFDSLVPSNSLSHHKHSAQKLGTQVDSLNLGRVHSSFLQQAAFLTGGVYLYDKADQRDMLQRMITHFLPSWYGVDNNLFIF